MEKTFSIHTVGCKLNQFESERIRQALARRGWEHRGVEEPADVHIVNSCTVTARGDARSRGAVRRARRVSPGAFVVMAGCYPQAQPEQCASMAEVDLSVGSAEKERLPAILDEIASGRSVSEARSRAAACGADPRPGIEEFLGHARAFVKIQDGCDGTCSYCIVPSARGPSRSTAPEEIVAQVETLHAAGYAEIVLTGVHIGRYGVDLVPSSTLADLIEILLDRTKIQRIRLSSIEPMELAPRLVSLARDTGRVAPHFHIPLQSGDDDILRAMNRVYGREAFRARIEMIAREVRDAAIGVDVIAGFPGETQRRFDRTVALIRELPVAYLHAFGYSPRPGTSAAGMSGQIDAEEKKRRVRMLREIGEEKRRAFERSQIGREHLAVVESPARAAHFSRTLTGNYCEVLVPAGGAAARSIVRLRITGVSKGALYGALVPRGGIAAPRAVAYEP